MAIDVDSLTPKQLSELLARVEQRQKSIDSERIEKVRKKVATMVKAEGLTLEELFGKVRKTRGPGRPKGKSAAKAKTKAKRPLPPKFRNPAAPTETWSGRGKRPRWYVAAVAAGKKDKDLLIR
ncbi:MAG: H-NS histone family protein [Tahibacter sp.]